jgi:hypothetical protein
MKRQQYNDEELYQEFMAELDKGAAEYDHMMASGVAPAKRNKATTMKWYAVAAAVAGLLIISTTLFVRHQDNVSLHTTSTESAKKEKLLTGKKTIVPRTENTDDLYRLTARIERKPEKKQQTASNNIFTAMLPDVVFCSDSNDDPNNDIRLPQVRKERSFDLVCNVVLPDITAYADSTLFTSNTELMVACDEICYNDTNF